MNQAGQLQLCAVMLAEARLVGRKVGEDVFVEAGVNYFFLYLLLLLLLLLFFLPENPTPICHAGTSRIR